MALLRRTGRQAGRTAFFWLLVSPLTPAAADDLGDAIASVNRAMVGHWTGSSGTLDPATGETSSAEDAFNFAVTSDDGTDFAFWRADAMTLADYQGDGVYLQRTFTADGAVSEDTVSTGAVEVPDETGAWSLVETQIAAGADGATVESRTSYRFADGVLTSLSETRRSGSDEAFAPVGGGEWTLQR